MVNGLRVDYLSPALYVTDLIIISLFFLSRFKIRVPLFAIIFFTLNLLISFSPFVTIYKWLRILEYFWLFRYLVSRFHYSLFTIYYSLSLATIWTSLLAWLQFFKQGSLGGLLYWLGERAFDITTPGIAKITVDGQLILRPYATLPHPNALAGFLLVSGLIIIYLTTSPHPSPDSGEGATRRGLTYLAVILAALTIPVTFSRTTIFLELTILSLFLLSKIILLPPLFTIYYPLFIRFGNPSSLMERIYLIRKSISIIYESPLFGVGLGNFIPFPYSPLPTPYSLTTQPVHNIFLLLASELGLPAALLISHWGIKLLRYSLRFDSWALGFALLSALLTGMADHYWLTLHQNFLLLAVLISIIYIKSFGHEPRTK